MSPQYPAIDLGPLPVEAINRALGTELEPGPARLSAFAHWHIARDHPEDYEACIAGLPQAIASPSFVGQSPKHRENFELIRRIARPDGKAVLVAIALERDRDGSYRVRSSYLIAPEKVDARRRAGRLKGILPP